MEKGNKRLVRELWDIMISDGGKRVEAVRQLKRRDDRRGGVKRLMIETIKDSSLCYFNGSIYYFGGKVYERMPRPVLFDAFYDIAANYLELRDADLNNLKDVYSDCLNAVYSKSMEVDNTVMVFKNGVLDVEHMEFHKKFDKRFVQMWSVDYSYNKDARTFLWHQFINQVLPDKYLQDVLQMFLGATFIDREKVKIEHILILLGKGANGKSVIQRTVRGVLGEEYVTTQEVGRLCSRGPEGDMAVAEINGKRLNYCTEMEMTDFYKKSARLKAIISGEKVPARRLYDLPFYADNLPLLMANANQIPVFNKSDDALLRRIYVIPFNVIIPPERQNKTLNDELVAEYPAILNWILEGRKKFIQNGYCLPKDVNFNKIIVTKKIEFNSALKYMDVCCYKPRQEGIEMMPLSWMTLSELYSGYERWCGANQLEPMGRKVFSASIEDEGGFQKRKRNAGISFGIFGDRTINVLKREQRRLKKVADNQPKAQVMSVGGQLYASSLKALALYSGVTINTVLRLNREGRFKEYKKAFREKAMYEIDGCCQVMRSLLILATDEQKAIDKRIRQDLKYIRYTFNQRMAYLGWPYRKYSREEPQIDDWCVVVPDEEGDKEILARAMKDGLDVSRFNKFKSAVGAHSKGGKGFLDSLDEIPTDEERASITEIKNQ